jgi:MFS family permease
MHFVTQAHTGPNPTRLFLAGVLTFALTGAIPAVYGMAVPILSQRLGLPETTIGYLISANGLGACCLVVAGIFGLPGLSARLALTLLALGGVGIYLAPTWPLVLCAALVAGGGFGLSAVVFNRRFLTEFGARGPGMVGLINAAFAIGAIAGPFLVIAAQGNVTLVMGAIGLILALMIPVVQPSQRQAAATTLAAPRLDRRWIILVFAALAVTVEVGVYGFGPAALIQSGWTVEQTARLTSGFFLAFLLGRLALFWLTRKIRVEWLYLASLIGSCASLALAAMGAPALGFVAAGAFIGMSFPSYFVWVSNILGADNRVASSVIATSLGGATVGPLILGPVLNGLGTQSIFAVAAVLSGLTAVLMAAAIVWQSRTNPQE